MDIDNIVKTFEEFKQEDFFSTVKTAEEIKLICKNILDEIITEKAERLIIFIDELDRCRPTYAVEMLERIKHYFDDERVVFVFSINRGQLSHTISNYYGAGFDSGKYLNRFFDYCFELPDIDIETSLQTLGHMRSDSYLSCISMELQNYYNMKLRDAISYTDKMETISDNVQASGISGVNAIMILLMVPVICALNYVSIEQKNQVLNGTGWSILENIILNCPKYYAECVEKLIPKNQWNQNINAREIFKKYYEYAFKQTNGNPPNDVPFVLRTLKKICIKFCNEFN